jgi:hypothetical protein
MADANLLARTYARRKTKFELEKALDVLLDEGLASDHVRSQTLAEVGFTFQIRSQSERERAIAIIEAAIGIHDGTYTPSPASGHSMDFSTRRIE